MKAHGRVVGALVALCGASSVVAQTHTVAHPTNPGVHAGFEVVERTIDDLQQAMTAGRVRSAQLVDAYLARIAAYDHAGPAINAMIRLNPRARADARLLDAERRTGHVRGPLHGIPIILKDNFDTRDLPTSAGSLALANHQPREDAFIVRKLRDAGAVILGKANMQEFAAGVTTISSLGGQTRNPYDLARAPGGSSGGTGAAIAASFATIGWGSDACGSIRLPSAFAALFGLRPSMGLFSRTGIVPIAHSQDVPGPLARTVRDLAIGLDATLGADAADPVTQNVEGRERVRFVDALHADALVGARIGMFTPYFRNADADAADTVRSAARSLAAQGAEVVDVNMPDFDELIAGSGAGVLEMRFDLADYFARPGGAPVASLAEIVAAGLYDKAQEGRYRSADTTSGRDSDAHHKMLTKQRIVRARIIALMDSLRLDALAYPTSVRKPVLIGDPQLGVNCALSAQTGLPAISMPAGFTGDGLPTGLELMARPFADARLVGFAFAYEHAGARRRPPPSTPPLVAGRAPTALRFTTIVGPAAAHVVSKFTFDPTRGELRYDVRVVAPPTSTIQAVVIRRKDASGSRVVTRLLGPGMTMATDVVRLLGDDLDALDSGRLSLALFTSGGVEPIAESTIQLPRRRP